MTALTTWATTILLIVWSADPVPEESEVKPGPMMLIVIVGLVAASVLLWLSMRKQLRKIRMPEDDDRVGDVDDDRPGDRPVS
jgi:hypothetical protein